MRRPAPPGCGRLLFPVYHVDQDPNSRSFYLTIEIPAEGYEDAVTREKAQATVSVALARADEILMRAWDQWQERTKV